MSAQTKFNTLYLANNYNKFVQLKGSIIVKPLEGEIFLKCEISKSVKTGETISVVPIAPNALDEFHSFFASKVLKGILEHIKTEQGKNSPYYTLMEQSMVLAKEFNITLTVNQSLLFGISICLISLSCGMVDKPLTKEDIIEMMLAYKGFAKFDTPTLVVRLFSAFAVDFLSSVEKPKIPGPKKPKIPGPKKTKNPKASPKGPKPKCETCGAYHFGKCKKQIPVPETEEVIL